MAEIGNTHSGLVPTKKVYATDEAGMLDDAKSYAKQDFKSVVDTIKKLGIEVTDSPNGDPLAFSEESIAKALVIVKLTQIKEARLNRVSYFD